MADAQLGTTGRETSPTGRVSTLELFFDLVFVFTITQVALIVEHHASWDAVVQALLELLAIYWMYGGYAWLTNALGSDTHRQRLVLLLGMAAFLVVSLAVPRAFDADGVAFGVAYLVLNVVHLAGFLIGQVPEAARAMVRIGSTNLLAAVLILIAGIVGGSAHWTLWSLAIAVQWLPPLTTRGLGVFGIGVEHFAERHGLMIIIVLGESLVSVALAAQELEVTVALVTGTLCGLAASAAMWWCYFDHDSSAAARQLEARASSQRGRVALLGYDLPHVLMMAGVVGVAAGTRLSLPELTSPATLAAASLLAGGAGVYLVALALFRAGLRYGNPAPRLVTGALVLATIPIATHVGAAQQLAVIAAVIVAMLLAERVAEPRPF